MINNNEPNPNPLIQYTQHLIQQNKSTNTIKSYTKDITSFFAYFNQTHNIPQTLTRSQIIQYKQHLLTTKNNAKSINRTLSSLKSYNEFLVFTHQQNEVVVLSIDYIKIQKQLVSPTNTSTKDAIRFMEKVKKNEPIRNYYIVKLILNTGLRISEILNLELTDIFLNKNKLRVIGKGNKQREIPINDEAKDIIKQAIEDRKNYNYALNVLNSPYLFLSNKTDKLESCTIERIFNKYSNTITPHKLRHVFATNFLENGGDIRSLQQILGHGSLSTTAIYTHPTEASMRKSMNNCAIR